ncbi:hypothetical protein EDC96DRAFT_570298 [Choanephora cucurbitarum]|nr:hypothetical protein EDC96DRAFT_570298 [Choanephora cucurbitarum]
MYNLNNTISQSSSGPIQPMSTEDGRNLTQLVHTLLAKVDHLQESLDRLQISNGSQSNDSNNGLSHEDVQTLERYSESLYRTVRRMNDTAMERWYDENRGDRIYHSSFSGHFKSKAIQVAKLYITSKTNWNLAGEALDEQAEVMYQNTRFLARGFCVRHFKQKKNTDFLFSQLSRRDSDHYARQLDFVVMKSIEDVDEDDMANALLPLHMAMDSWLARAILSSIFRNSRPKKAASGSSTQIASQAEDFSISNAPQESNISYMAEDEVASENQSGQGVMSLTDFLNDE